MLLKIKKDPPRSQADKEEKEEKEDDQIDDLEIDIKPKEDAEDTVVVSKSKMVLVNKLLKNVKENNEKVIQLLSGFVSDEDEKRISISQIGDLSKTGEEIENEVDGKIIEGVFDGENMIGPDGKQYGIPANYASKSKLVEGDILKLTITARGTFMYKQIGPIERKRIVGQLSQESEGNFLVLSDGRKWHVLTASVTYYKGESGDEVVILVPKNGDSKWAAVENIVNKSE